jgi:uncharacterized protein involved in exopolysaccharide biosynthesis
MLEQTSSQTETINKAYDKLAELLKSRKFWTLIIALMTVAAGYNTGQVDAWQALYGAVAALSVYAIATGLDSPVEQQPNKFIALLQSRKFWATVLALLTVLISYCTGQVEAWQAIQAALGALGSYALGVSLTGAIKQ